MTRSNISPKVQTRITHYQIVAMFPLYAASGYDHAYSLARANSSSVLVMGRSGYSTKVSLSLVVNGRSIALSHVGPGNVIAKDVKDPICGGCDAQLVISVDDRTKSRDIFLPRGVQSGANPYI
jgi:hypothetical protein